MQHTKVKTTDTIHGFPPLAAASANRLILGSMPSVASLEAGEYYAFPRNAFWHIMGDLFDAGPELAYRRRVARLNAAGIALWDVVSSCTRPGSLDSAIANEGLESNDFQGFFREHPGIGQVYFNGQKASSLFKKRVLPTLDAELELHTLPSTSPANAGLNYAAKLEAWSVVKTG